jgi:hypothetical protein
MRIRFSFVTILVAFSDLIFSQCGNFDKIAVHYGTFVSTVSHDINGDTYDDYVAGYKNDILWYANLGDNNFSLGKYICSAQTLTSLISTDVNSDGILDLLFTDVNGVFLVHGILDGFSDDVIMIASGDSKGVAAEDIDGDGDKDLVVSSTGVKWYQNDGTGNFDYVNFLGVFAGGGPKGICTPDLDGDGDFDVAVAYSAGKVSWFQNDGSGIFGDQINIDLTADDAYHIAAGDVDNDGDVDLVASGFYGGVDIEIPTRFYKNAGAGTFYTQTVLLDDLAIKDLKLFDYDADEDLDILLISVGQVKVFPLAGVIYGAEIAWPAVYNRYSLGIVDANDDDNLDLITSFLNNGSGDNILHINNGDATYDEIGSINNSVYSVNKNAYSVDINSDSHVDVVYLVNKKIEYIKNRGEEGFAHLDILKDGINAKTFAVGDMNADGFLDLVYSHFDTEELFWLENDGLANFGDPQLVFDGTGAEVNIGVADLNEDGFDDIFCAAVDKISVYFNDGLGTFGDQLILSDGTVNPVDIVAFDMNSDGDKEIFASNYTSNTEVFFYENIGGTTFSDASSLGVITNELIEFDFGDLDANGFKDLVVLRKGSSEVYWFPNDGASFSPHEFAGVGPVGCTGLNVVDLDLDGDLDIQISSPLPAMKEFGRFENAGDGVFNEYMFNGEGFYSGVFAADFDEDGDIDQGVIDATKGIHIYHNCYYSPVEIRGKLFIDNNLNGLYDEATDYVMTFVEVQTDPSSDFAYTSPFGNYFINISDTAGVYSIMPEELEHWSIVTDSLSYTIVIDEFLTSRDSLDFGLYPDSLFDAIEIDITGGNAKCDNLVNYWINVENTGTTLPSGVLELTLDDSLIYESSSVEPDSIIGQTIYWSYDSLYYFSNYRIRIAVQMPDYLSEGDEITSFFNATVDSLGDAIITIAKEWQQTVVCSCDPNDKMATPAGSDSLGYIPMDVTELEYLIRFQNTGSDTAANVVIKDQLDVNLDWNTFDIISSSHFMDAEVSGGEIKFRFDDIMLPDSNVNELESHGYVKFRIRLDEGLAPETSIYNTAHIYFDYNPAIITNTKINTLYDCSTILSSLTVEESEVCPNTWWEARLGIAPPNVNYYWSIDDVFESEEANLVWLTDETGFLDVYLNITTDLCDVDTTFQLFVHELSVNLDVLADETLCLESEPVTVVGLPDGGVYSGVGVVEDQFTPLIAGEGDHTIYYTVVDDNGCSLTDSIPVSVVDCLGLTDEDQVQITVFPNPFDDYTTINFGTDLVEGQIVLVSDVLGKEIYRKESIVGSSLVITKDEIGAGIYLLSLTDPNSKVIYTSRLVVK